MARQTQDWHEWVHEAKAELRLPFGHDSGGFLIVSFGTELVTAEFTPAQVGVNAECRARDHGGALFRGQPNSRPEFNR